MSLSAQAVRRPVATLMIFCVIALIGGYSLVRLDVDVFPEIDFPSISVITEYPGVSPEDMETLVTRPIEGALARVDNVARMESFSAEGRSRVALRFGWGTELETATSDVRSALERVRERLPPDVRPPIVFKFDISSFPVVILALEADRPEGQLRRFAEDRVKPFLERTAGVASADVSGLRAREVRVAIEPERLAALGFSPNDVVAALRQANSNVASGLVGDGSRKILLRPMSEARSLPELSTATLGRRGGRIITVADVAHVEESLEDTVTISRINGQRGATLRVQKASGANTVRVADELRATVAKFNEEYAGQAKLTVVVDSSVFVKRSINDAQSSVGFGAALALAVLLLFLRSVRSTLVVAIAIPLSILATFFAMQQLGLTLNLITFGGIALGLGMLVDNAIVILENIFRRKEAGDAPQTAAIQGASEVSSAVVASTLTTLAVFVPVLFLGGFPAIFFGQMALVVTASLLCSLVVALTLVPVAASLLLSRANSSRENFVARLLGRSLDLLDTGYASLVKWALRLPWLVLLAGGASVYAAYTLAADIGAELLPESDESEVRITAQLPAGTRIEATEAGVAEIEALVRTEVPEATDILSTVGTPGFWSTSGEEFATMRINLTDVTARQRSSDQIARDLTPILEQHLPDMRIQARAGGGLWLFQFIRGGDDRLVIQIRGWDLEAADALATELAQATTDLAGVSDARPSRLPGGREERIYVDRHRAQDVGLSVRTVAEALSTLTQGTLAGVYREGGDELPVRVRLPQSALESTQRILAAPLIAQAGRPLRVRDLATSQIAPSPKAIDRLDQERLVLVNGGLDATRPLGEVNADLQRLIDGWPKPDGFSLSLGGEAREQEQSFGALGGGFILALLLVYMVMAGQFESFVQPLVVMTAVPLAGLGAVLTMRATDTTLNLNSALGAIVLVGIVVNNAIVLVDYTNLLRRRDGLPLKSAIIESARRRLRPILMTAATTILALLPVALASGSGSEAQAPLARVVVGGLTSSSLITLFVVPVLYWLTESIIERLQNVRPSRS